MSYQALLFSPDEKTTRTVTQVLSELDFAVEACGEPFAAVKKLMGHHFDAVVVDCENEQNATLLFKSARGSASNQTSLAVAVVEGQAGVAKAFRIGANLVLTKPINVEQAKGTLRVARGLLRKGEPTKSPTTVSVAGTNSGSSEPQKAGAQVSAPSTGVPHPTPASASFMSPAASQMGPQSQLSKSTAAFPPHAKTPSDEVDDDSIIDVLQDTPSDAPIPHLTTPPPATTPAKDSVTKVETKPAKSTPGTSTTPPRPTISAPPHTASFTSGTGSASAPALAREGQAPEAAATSTEIRRGLISHAGQNPELSENVFAGTADPLPTPSFAFGGTAASSESTRGGSKKVFFAVAACLMVAVGLYVAWTQFRGKVRVPLQTAKPVAEAANQAPDHSMAAPTSTQSPAPITQGISQSKPSAKVALNSANDERFDDSGSAPGSGSILKSSTTSPATKDTLPIKPSEHPIVVKNNRGVAKATKPASEAPAPSVIGIASQDVSGPMPSLMETAADAPQPVLQTLNVSQGVSQGLLIKKVQPSYPSNALRLHVEGAVQLQATIGKAGNIVAVKVLTGDPLLARAASDAVHQWKYKPYLLNGEPVEIQTQITVNFKLPK